MQFAACKADCVALVFEHPMLPIHKTSCPLCQPQQQAMKHQAQCAMYDTDRIAPNGLSLEVLAAAQALLVVQVLAEGLLVHAAPQPHHPAARVCKEWYKLF